MESVFRFAPSPSGYLHVGGARTAIFNWLLARKFKGKFLLRIEDTDRARSTKESIQQILSGLKWLKIDWDGEIIFQSSRKKRHLEKADQLLNENKAYRCFCTREELEAKRLLAEQQKINKRYDGTCRNLTPDQINENLAAGKPFAIRFKVPAGQVVWKDLIHGEMVVNNDTLDDFIIVRSDGNPVYQLSVVADDHDMGVTTVLRGDDHLANTNKQILLYRALSWPVPEFGHLPLILGQDKKRLSKRHGATSVEEFKDRGIFPETLFNYLCLLGWSPGTEREIFSREELIREFSIDRINHTPAVFDEKKLIWLNAKYMANKSNSDLKKILQPWIRNCHWNQDGMNQSAFDLLLNLVKIRAKSVIELQEAVRFYFEDPGEYEEKGIRKYFSKKENYEILNALSSEYEQWSGSLHGVQEIEDWLRAFAEKRGQSAGKIIHPLRLALTGKTASPGIFEIIHILGRDKVLRRLKKATEFMDNLIE